MNKRKRFNIPTDIQEGIGDVISAVTNNAGKSRFDVISLSRIETDPDNPRELLLTAEDITNGINVDDPDASAKNQEKEELLSLSHTINKDGLINPVVVYRQKDAYRLVAGERRFLASLLSGKPDIHARILSQKPDVLNLRLLQWIENNERSDLSLRERLSNLQSIIDAYCSKHHKAKATISDLVQLTGLSKVQSSRYLSIIYGSDDVRELVNMGKINNIENASFLVGIKEEKLRKQLLDACVHGNSLSQLKKMLNAEKNQAKERLRQKSGKRGRAAQYINLGRVKNPIVVKKIVDSVIAHPNYVHHASLFDNVEWDNYGDVSAVFSKLLVLLAEK